MKSTGDRPLHARLHLRRIFDHAVGEKERQQAERKVDEEDPVPVVVVGDPAAERGADGRSDDDGHAVEREGLAAFFDGEGVGEDRLFAGGESAAAETLQDAREDEQRERGRETAEQRADREHHHAGHVEALAAEAVGEPAGDGQNHGRRDEIAGQHPGRLFLARRRPSPAMCGSATLAMEVSSTSMNVAIVTVSAISHGLCLGFHAACSLVRPYQGTDTVYQGTDICSDYRMEKAKLARRCTQSLRELLMGYRSRLEDALRGEGLTLPQLRLLNAIREQGGRQRRDDRTARAR